MNEFCAIASQETDLRYFDVVLQDGDRIRSGSGKPLINRRGRMTLITWPGERGGDSVYDDANVSVICRTDLVSPRRSGKASEIADLYKRDGDDFAKKLRG